MSSDQMDENERRNHERHPITETTSLTVVTEAGSFPCVVEDLSFGGIRLRFDGDIPAVEELRLEHPTAGTFVGRCAWSGNRVVGVQFDEQEREIERALQCVALMVTSDDSLQRRAQAEGGLARAGYIKGQVA